MVRRGSFESFRRIWLWWTGDKDAAWALKLLQSSSHWEVRGLITVVGRSCGRHVVHGVRRELLEEQATAVGLPLLTIECEGETPSGAYESAVQDVLGRFARDGTDFVAFGDLSCPRKRIRRSLLLAGTGLRPAFPLWGRNSRRHADELLSAGLSAWVCAVATAEVRSDLAGSTFDKRFLAALPDHVAPSGDSGEFHTFVEWAPGWDRRVSVEPSRLIERGPLTLADLEVAPAGVRVREDRFYSLAREERDPFECDTRLRRVIRYVDAHLADELRLESLASVAAMTPSGFEHYFRQHVGMSFREWLVGHRVAHARRLLRRCDMTVAAVGRIAGFSCSRTFRRVFRARSGCSPSRYRRRYLNNAVGAGKPGSWTAKAHVGPPAQSTRTGPAERRTEGIGRPSKPFTVVG